MMTGGVAFLMCIQARQLLLSFVPGTFIGAAATICRRRELAAGGTFSGARAGVWLRDEKLWAMAGPRVRGKTNPH